MQACQRLNSTWRHDRIKRQRCQTRWHQPGSKSIRNERGSQIVTMPFKQMKGIGIEGVVEFKLALNLFISAITNLVVVSTDRNKRKALKSREDKQWYIRENQKEGKNNFGSEENRKIRETIDPTESSDELRSKPCHKSSWLFSLW